MFKTEGFLPFCEVCLSKRETVKGKRLKVARRSMFGYEIPKGRKKIQRICYMRSSWGFLYLFHYPTSSINGMYPLQNTSQDH